MVLWNAVDWRIPLLLVLIGWGVWYLWWCDRRGEAPGPPFGIQRQDTPAAYWFFTLTYALVLVFCALGLGMILFEE